MARAWSLALLFHCSGAVRKSSQNKSRVVPLAVVSDIQDVDPVLFDDHDTDAAKAAEETYADVAPALDTDMRSCGCRYSRYSYQVWPRNQNGGGCVGGCGGAEFQINRHGGTIKEMMVWTGTNDKNSHIKAIRFTYHDNHRVVKGDSRGGGGPWTFRFNPGEYVVGDVALSGDGRGRRLGSIRFGTSLGRTFDVGMRSPFRYLFPSGNSYITGFMGRAGSDIDQLGFVFWKPITSITYESITYPTLQTLARIRAPARVESRTYCNAAPIPLPSAERWIFENVTTGENSCLESNMSTQFSASVRVSGGIPIVKEFNGEAHWNVSASRSQQNCRNYSRTVAVNLTFPGISVPANTRFEYTYSQWKGTLNRLPFVATLNIRMNDGTSFKRRETGTYEGVSFNDIKESYDNFESNVTSCR